MEQQKVVVFLRERKWGAGHIYEMGGHAKGQYHYRLQFGRYKLGYAGEMVESVLLIAIVQKCLLGRHTIPGIRKSDSAGSSPEGSDLS
jgi:hypothetical protein